MKSPFEVRRLPTRAAARPMPEVAPAMAQNAQSLQNLVDAPRHCIGVIARLQLRDLGAQSLELFPYRGASTCYFYLTNAHGRCAGNPVSKGAMGHLKVDLTNSISGPQSPQG
jgi:hypothetical protein